MIAQRDVLQSQLNEAAIVGGGGYSEREKGGLVNQVPEQNRQSEQFPRWGYRT